MIDIRHPIGVPVIWVLMAMYLPGDANSQLARNQFRPSPICEAIVSGNVDRAMQLVKQGEDVNAASGCALFAAAGRGQLELVKLLLDHKADPNRRLSGDLTVIVGTTPLSSAVQSRKVQMVQMLLEGGANPRNDLDAFQVVINFGDVEMAELLLRHGANANMTYPLKGDVTVYQPVSERESRGITVPRRDLEPDRIDDTLKRFQCRISEGESLLYSTVRSGSPGTGDGRDRIAKLLIDHGADPNARALNGSTPLMMAASQHNHRVMTMLMDARADVKATDRCGRTAEDYAVLYPKHQRAPLAPQTKALLQDRQRK
jgi:ankyrin repeat protein